MKTLFTFLLFITFSLLGRSQLHSAFSEAALKESFTSLNGKQITFENIMKNHQGKVIFIKLWASWCKDCLADLPDAKELKKAYKNITFINLSLDRDAESWKRGVDKHKISGENYLITKGWKKSAFCKNIKLNWIPRYMIINAKGEISLFQAIKAKDPNLIKLLKETL